MIIIQNYYTIATIKPQNDERNKIKLEKQP